MTVCFVDIKYAVEILKTQISYKIHTQMMIIRPNSKVMHAFLAGRVLLFLFSMFPILGFAVNGDADQIMDSLAYVSPTKVNMYVSEGTTIYNGTDIYLVDSNANSIKETTKKHQSTKIATASTSLKKSKKNAQYLQHRKVPLVKEHFNCLPLDPASSFSKNNNKENVSLLVNQQQIKIIGIMTHYVFYMLNGYESKNSSDFAVNIIRKDDQWQIHTRPPPYNII